MTNYLCMAIDWQPKPMDQASLASGDRIYLKMVLPFSTLIFAFTREVEIMISAAISIAQFYSKL